jgi:hypothetical protein
MKMKLEVVLFFAAILCGKSSMSQISEVEINNRNVLEAIELFIDSLNISAKKGAVVVEFGNIEVPQLNESSEAYFRHEVSKARKGFQAASETMFLIMLQPDLTSVRKNPPLGYCILKGKPILFYSKANLLIKANQKATDNFCYRMKKFFKPEKKNTLIPIGPIWQVKISEGRIYIDD